MPTINPVSEPNIILDAHQDIAWNRTFFNRDFTHSALQKRQAEIGSRTASVQGGATCGLPESLLGRVGIIFGTIYAPPTTSTLSMGRGYETPAQAYRLGQDQLDVYHRLADSHPQIMMIRNQAELRIVLESWAEGVDVASHKVGIVCLMEGADPITEPAAFDEWYERGVRIVGPAWMGETRYACGTGKPGGFSNLGRELLDVMASYHAVLDLSHLNAQACLEGLDRYEGHIIASHSNPRKFCDNDRHLSDDAIRRLAERDGVMGLVLYNLFMWQVEPKKADAPLVRIVEMVDHVCQITGSARHVGIGTDWDGGFGVEHIPAPMDTVADLRLLRPALAARGYGDSDIRLIESGNFLRILRAALPD